MPKNSVQNIAEQGIEAAQTGIKNIGDEVSQITKATGQQIGVLPTPDDKALEEKESEQKKRDEEEIAKKQKELEQMKKDHFEQAQKIGTTTQPTQSVQTQPEEPAEPKTQILPPLDQPLLPSSPDRSSPLTPTKGKPFV